LGLRKEAPRRRKEKKTPKNLAAFLEKEKGRRGTFLDSLSGLMGGG